MGLRAIIPAWSRTSETQFRIGARSTLQMFLKIVRSPGFRSVFSRICLVSTTLPLLACSSDAGNGTLVVNWTVNSTSDAALCDENVGWVEVEIRDPVGNRSTRNGPCHAFSTAFGGISSEAYTLSAYLFNAGNDATLSTVNPRVVDLSADVTSTVTIDFPIAVTN